MNRDNAKVSARRLTALLASTAIVLHPFGVLAGDALPLRHLHRQGEA